MLISKKTISKHKEKEQLLISLPSLGHSLGGDLAVSLLVGFVPYITSLLQQDVQGHQS